MSEAIPVPLPSAASILRSPAVKAGVILLLLLLMQIPLFMVSSLIEERQIRQAEVAASFARGWGPAQVLAGPSLVVPYSYVQAVTPGGVPVQAHGYARLAASRLHVAATLVPETRRRGLFHAVVYSAAVTMEGVVTVPPLLLKDYPDAVVHWADARILLGASDLRAQAADPRLDWNGVSHLLTATDWSRACGGDWLSAPAGLSAAPDPDQAFTFKTALDLRGTQAFRVVAQGKRLELQVSSAWPTPSFVGAALPITHAVSAAGFDARWDEANGVTGGGWTQQDSRSPVCDPNVDAASSREDTLLGVELQEAVPTYLMVSRAAKYGVLFLALSYLTLFLFEALAAVRIHLVQYGLLGLSVSLFALLLISIAEPLGFALGYVLSTAAVMAQASLYTWSVTGRWRLTGVFAGVLGVLFGFLYVVLSLDSYALLAGTVALFAILSVVMVVTRRVNWSSQG